MLPGPIAIVPIVEDGRRSTTTAVWRRGSSSRSIASEKLTMSSLRTHCSWIFALVTYLFLDFADPFMPGAWSFDSGQSVDGAVHGHCVVRGHLGASLPAPMPWLQRSKQTPVTSVKREPRAGAPVTVWVALAREAHSPSVDPAPLVEDH